MKCVIDAREAFASQRAGKASWTKGFLEELRKRGLSLDVLADERAPKEGCTRYCGGPFWHVRAARYAKQSDADCYVSPTSFITPWLLGSSFPFLPVVHDLVVYRPEPHEWKAAMIEKTLLPRVLRRAPHICTVSGSTKADLIAMFPDIPPEKITPIFAGPLESAPAQSQPDGKTILCVGTLCPRKNQLRLIRAYASLPAELRSRYRLVLAGARGWHDGPIIRYAQNTKGVEWKNFVSDAEYKHLLSTATVFAYPSLYEGFGMQVLDALQRGIPVVTSERGSLAEVVGGSAVVVDPESEQSIASGLVAVLDHEDVRAKLRERGPKQAEKYSWKHTVDLFLEALQKAV